MHLYKRGKIWWIEYEVDGKRYRKSTGTTDRRQAQQWMSSIKTASNMPTYESAVEVLKTLFRKMPSVGSGNIILSTAWEQYRTTAQAIGKLSLARKTIVDRRNRVRGFVAWASEHAATIKTVEAVSGPIAAKYAEHLASKGLSAKTRKNAISDLSTVWSILEKASDEVRNPWANLIPSGDDGERIPPFTPEEQRRVLEAARKVGKDWYPVSLTARYTGLRYGDIATLRWDEIDLDKGVLRRKPNKTQRFDISVTLPLMPILVDCFKGLNREGDYLFPLHAHYYGKRGKNVQRIMAYREVLDLAGISKEHTFHSWRHSCATALGEAGVSKEVRKMILGHTTDENASRYDHSEHLEEMRKALDSSMR